MSYKAEERGSPEGSVGRDRKQSAARDRDTDQVGSPAEKRSFKVKPRNEVDSSKKEKRPADKKSFKVKPRNEVDSSKKEKRPADKISFKVKPRNEVDSSKKESRPADKRSFKVKPRNEVEKTKKEKRPADKRSFKVKAGEKKEKRKSGQKKKADKSKAKGKKKGGGRFAGKAAKGKAETEEGKTERRKRPLFKSVKKKIPLPEVERIKKTSGFKLLFKRPLWGGIALALLSMGVLLLVTLIKNSPSSAMWWNTCFLPQLFVAYIVLILFFYLASLVLILVGINRRFKE